MTLLAKLLTRHFSNLLSVTGTQPEPPLQVFNLPRDRIKVRSDNEQIGGGHTRRAGRLSQLELGLLPLSFGR